MPFSVWLTPSAQPLLCNSVARRPPQRHSSSAPFRCVLDCNVDRSVCRSGRMHFLRNEANLPLVAGYWLLVQRLSPGELSRFLRNEANSPLVAGCWLFVAGCWLLATKRSQFQFGCSVFPYGPYGRRSRFSSADVPDLRRWSSVRSSSDILIILAILPSCPKRIVSFLDRMGWIGWMERML